MKYKIYFFTVCLSILTACAELTQVANQLDIDIPLTEEDIAKGLKEALRVGTDSAVATLSQLNGYYGDDLVKILLPEEAKIIVDNANIIPEGQKVIDDVILSINRAAEDAAKEAGSIFYQAITEMTITDAVNILNGSQNEATNYFKSKTYDKLFDLYNPKIKTSIDKEIISGVSAGKTWDTMTKNYNTLANSFVGKMADLKPVDIDLNEYLTQKALDGLFLKIETEEKLIRTDPAARVTDILKRVFK